MIFACYNRDSDRSVFVFCFSVFALGHVRFWVKTLVYVIGDGLPVRTHPCALWHQNPKSPHIYIHIYIYIYVYIGIFQLYRIFYLLWWNTPWMPMISICEWSDETYTTANETLPWPPKAIWPWWFKYRKIARPAISQCESQPLGVITSVDQNKLEGR